jgi:hypothetical protein
MDPAELAVFFPFLFLELPNPNLWPAEGAGPTLNLPENGHGYPPGLKVAEAVPSLHALLLKITEYVCVYTPQFCIDGSPTMMVSIAKAPGTRYPG